MTTNRYPLDLVNGQQIFRVAGGPGATQQIVFACAVYPSAGTLTLEAQYAGSTAWSPVYKGNNLPATAPVVLAAFGAIGAYRVTLAGIVGGAGLEAWASQGEAQGFPDGAFVGLRALTVQPYSEANVKNGVQFYARAAWPLTDVIASGTTRKLFFQTGAKQVLVKLRDFQFVAEELRLNLYRTPTGVTGGTALTIHNYNGVNPVGTTVSATKNVTTTTNGAEFDGGDPEYFYGSANAPQRQSASIPQGRERVLPSNTTFLVAITNTGSGDGRAQYYLDWYEGGTDLPSTNP